MSYKLFLSNDIVNFIESFSKIETYTKSTNSSSVIYFIDSCFKTTENPNVFEVIDKTELIQYYSVNNETKQTDKE